MFLINNKSIRNGVKLGKMLGRKGFSSQILSLLMKSSQGQLHIKHASSFLRQDHLPLPKVDRSLGDITPFANRLFHRHCSTTFTSTTTSNAHFSTMFVPENLPVHHHKLFELQDFIAGSNKLLVLTGAGISTESGIPDYRSEGVGLYARSDSRPIQYTDFLNFADRRKRYWARNFVGWPRFGSFEPNECHIALSRWESMGKLHWLVTQNVDALHSKAGSERLTELHGCSHRIICLGCGTVTSRNDLQERMIEMNPQFKIESHAIAPDGDVLLPDDLVDSFQVPPCEICDGILKPHLIFFGDNVPRTTVYSVYDKLDESDALLVAGSSLQVYSGYRFARYAHDKKIPIAIINIGETRADKLATLKLDAKLGDVIPQIVIS